MASNPRQCLGVSDKVCNWFLPAFEKHLLFYDLCSSCLGLTCSIDSRCDHCISWSAEKWKKVNVYIDKLAAQLESKREKRTCSKSSSSFFLCFSSSSQIPILITQVIPCGSRKMLELSPSGPDNVIVVTVLATLSPFVTVYSFTTPIMPSQLGVSHDSVSSSSGELSKKRKREEHSEDVSCVSGVYGFLVCWYSSSLSSCS